VSGLRPLTALQSLTLSGNPLTSDPHYTQFTLAFLPSLAYLDFHMIFPEEREAVGDMFSEALAEVEMGEREVSRRREEAEAERQLQEIYKVSTTQIFRAHTVAEYPIHNVKKRTWTIRFNNITCKGCKIPCLQRLQKFASTIILHGAGCCSMKMCVESVTDCVQAAYVDGLQGTALFDSMFEEDGDADRISLLPGVSDMLSQ
jgi:hypothetical protein